MPLHVNGPKDVVSLRVTVVALALVAIMFSAGIIAMALLEKSIPPSMGVVGGAAIGALCAILGIKTATVVELAKGVKRNGRSGDGATGTPAGPIASRMSEQGTGPLPRRD